MNIDAMELRGFMLNSFLKFLSIYRNDLIFENVLIFLEKTPKPSPEDIFSLLLDREEERERERDRQTDRHRLFASEQTLSLGVCTLTRIRPADFHLYKMMFQPTGLHWPGLVLLF